MSLRWIPYFVLLLSSSVATANEADLRRALHSLDLEAAESLRSAISPQSGSVTFLGAKQSGLPIAADASATAAARARSFLQARAKQLRLPAADDMNVVATEAADETGLEMVRLRQSHRGIPVRFAEMTLHLRGAKLMSLHARTLPDLGEVEVTPQLSADAALIVARREIASKYGADEFAFAPPALELFNRGLVDGTVTPTRLAWCFVARSTSRIVSIWIDAQRGNVLFDYNQVEEALFRIAYDLNSTQSTETFVGDETSPPTSPQSAVDGFTFAGDTYEYFSTNHGRDSYDNAGSPMILKVRYCDANCGCPCLNAFWFGSYAAFGAPPTANSFDDIVGHEYTHGVTQYSAGLIYYRESGAMNESYSDIFGETIDLTNTGGYDGPGTRWLIGEASVLPTGGRNMMYPEQPLGFDPDKMSSERFYCGSGDNAGVHSNSAIGNHAYALMVDGGTFNGFTIAGIGLTKAAKIEYRALTRYLTPTSTYADNYHALLQSCSDLLGVVGISAADCTEVQKALDAVEMYAPWPCTCGDGVLDSEEQCDDGNRIDGDCCSALCQISNPGDACSDGNGCTSNETCELVDSTLTCLGSLGPRDDCRRSTVDAAAKLIIVNKRGNGANQLRLVSGKGAATTRSEFGNPVDSTDYTLCLYKNAYDSAEHPSLAFRLEIPGGAVCTSKPCWKDTGKGFKFSDHSGSFDGTTSLNLKEGTVAGKTKIQLKAKGENLLVPIPGDLAANLSAQIVSSNGLCWEARFDSPAVKLDSEVFKDTGR